MDINATIGGRIMPDPDVKIGSSSAPDIMEPVCGPLTKPYLLIVSIGPGLVSVENLVFLFAVLLYRQNLRHNNVYRYVTSALIANLLTSLWAFYHFLNYYYGLESATPTFWWAFRKGITAGFSLILCGNIGLLIYAIEDNLNLMGRLVSGAITLKKSDNRLTRQFRLKKALMLITATWIFPVLFGLLSMTPWNCTSQCSCTLYLEGQPLCKGDHCSSLYTPMSKSYLLVIVIVWSIECSFLLFVICKAAISFPNRGDGCSNGEDDNSEDKNPLNMNNVRGSNVNCERKVTSFRRFSPRLAKSHQFPFTLLGLFMLCTAPLMILIVLDFAVADFQASDIVINIIIPLPLLYCLVSPILLAKRLSGMKSALVMTLSFTWLKSGFSSFSRRNNRSNRSNNAAAVPIRGSVISLHSDDQGTPIPV